jgi:hypothetical protein
MVMAPLQPLPPSLCGLLFPASLASGDFNADGKQDILIGFPISGVSACRNGDGTFDLNLNNVQFVHSTSLIATNGQVTVFAADLTKNGKIDAVTSDFTTGTLQIALNAALGQGPPSAGVFSFALAPGISEVAAGDLNGDGVFDVVVINYSTSQSTVLLSQKRGSAKSAWAAGGTLQYRLTPALS